MNFEVLQTILVEEFDATQKDSTIDLPSGKRVTLMIAFGKEVLRVPKVRSVRFTKTYVAIIGENERFFVHNEHDFAVKSEDEDRRDDTRPGFH